MRSDTCANLQGSFRAEKRVMVRLHLPKDRDFDRIQLAVAIMGRDIKHSKHWLCEFCGTRPSRSVHVA